MKAVIIATAGDNIEGLEFTTLPLPEIGAGEVLVKIYATDINPVDQKTLQGKGQFTNLKKYDPIILGWDLSGEVIETGAEVTTLKKGDRVFGMINFPGHGKTYAEYAAAPADQLAIKPAHIDDETAAATTLAALTAFQVISKANIQPGERVLIQGAAGGVGFIALQIAKHLGAYVIGTGSAKDEALLKERGLDEFINYHAVSFEKVLSNIDMVLDTLGGEEIIKAFDILSPKGRLITIPSGKGEEWKAIAEEKGIDAQFMFVHSSGPDMKVLAEWLDQGIIRPNITGRYQMEEIIEVHRLLAAGKISGKIVVSMTQNEG